MAIGIIRLYCTYSYFYNTDTKNNLIARSDITYRVALDDIDFPPLVVYGKGVYIIFWGKKIQTIPSFE
jgi:hypothetical protein